MKYTFTTLAILLFSLTVLAQEGRPSHAQRIARESAYEKNQIVTIGDQIFDVRVLRHYSPAELKSLPATKLAQINFIYRDSYKVLNPQSCPSIRMVDVDVSMLEVYRKENESNIVQFGKDCKLAVELISRTALKEKMDALAK